MATEALKGKQAELNLPQHRLIQHVKTRWNSIYDMFECLLEQRWALAAVLSDRGFTKLTDARTLELADASWHVMEELLPVLKSLKCATTALCGETELSISMVHPITATLLSRYLRPTEGESPKVREFKGKVAESLSSRIEPENTDTAQKAALVASFLDPRNKNLRFTTDEVRAAVHTKVGDMLSNLPASLPDHHEEQALAPIPEKRAKHADAMLAFFGDEYFTEEPATTARSELERYLCEESISPTQDPALWWKLHESKYKRLSQLAKHYLCIPATSLPHPCQQRGFSPLRA